jgi:hypothetical protein
MSPPTVPSAGSFHRGRASVSPRISQPQPPITVPPATRPWQPDVRVPVRSQVRQLRRGGEWTWIGALFAFVCWGVWAVSARDADLVGPVLAFLLVLIIAAGVFTLSRLLGRVILERSLRRIRRSAWGSHLATGVFLIGAGIAYLGQTPWVVDAWTWFKELFY